MIRSTAAVDPDKASSAATVWTEGSRAASDGGERDH